MGHARPSCTSQPYAYLDGVTAGPGGTAWSVGSSCTACGTSTEGFKTLILRWNGAAWSQAPSPSPGASTSLGAVSAGPGGTAWAVGFTLDESLILRWDGRIWSRIPGPELRTMTLRRNGAAWSQVPSPGPRPGTVGLLNGVSAGPGGTAWAVGYSYTPAGISSFRAFRTLILRWNGATWSPG